VAATGRVNTTRANTSSPWIGDTTYASGAACYPSAFLASSGDIRNRVERHCVAMGVRVIWAIALSRLGRRETKTSGVRKQTGRIEIFCASFRFEHVSHE
jgi:hypothetical protein